MKKLYMVLVMTFVVTLCGFSQKPYFSNDKSKFYQELKAYLESATSKDDKASATVLMGAFEPVWNGQYGSETSQKAINFFNYLYAKSGNRAYYNIYTFTEALHHAPASGLSGSDLNRWLDYTTQRFSNRTSQLDKYLKSCRDLFADRILGEKGATKWIAQDATFSFPTDTAFVVEIPHCSLVLRSSKDQSMIQGTQGLFFMSDHRWKGKGGRVDWSRFGIPTDMVYAEVHDYQIDMLTSNYEIENVDFFNKYYFDHPVSCSFEDAVTNAAPNDKTAYPKVISHSDSYETGQLFEKIDFYCGFGMVGKSVNFFGTDQHPAQFVFKHKNRIAMRMLAKRFIMNENSLISNSAAARIYLYDSVNRTIDSIYHNDLGFRYDNIKHTLLLYRKDNGVGTGPYHDTYHEFDIFLEAVYWDTEGDVMEFRRIEGTSGVSEGAVSSVNYFRKSDYLKIQALDMKHPMESINKFFQLFGDGTKKFPIQDYADYIKYPLSQVTSLILNLQSEGYLEYDKDTKMVTLLDRFFDVLASDHGEFDFDVIRFQTRTTNRQPNIRLTLGTNDMLVYGIYDAQSESSTPSIILSDFKHVLILPENGRIVLKKHRNFNFSGCIMAGMYEFFTKDCLFNYSKFSIDMNKVDSLRFYARFDGRVYPVEGTLERLSGTLNIDENDNKSSKRETPDFPKFSCPGNSYKFYRDINGGVFAFDLPADSISEEVLDGKFYFCLDPFSMERLDNLESKDIAFKGRLVSGGIFPDIVEPLVVMDDHSLGFRHTIGNGTGDSYPMFGNKGLFHHEVFLLNEGFFGQGTLDVETSHYTAEKFDFYLDSVTASVQTFAMGARASGVHFPKASCGPLDLKWDVTLPQLYTNTKDEPICLYDSTYFRGQTMLSDKGFKGSGVLTFGLTRFDSECFDFDTYSFVADSSDFVLTDKDGSTKAFMAENYRSHVDLASKMVQYEYLDASSHLEFPLNQFSSSLREANWDMSANRIHLYSPTGSFEDYAKASTFDELLDVRGAASKFVSLLPEHDSLSFFSTNADYDMNDYVLHAHDVKIVRVADVAVFPSDANIEIQRNAQITPLEHATVLADTANRKHIYKDAEVTLMSRKEYTARGTKDYLDDQGVATPVFFKDMAPVDGVSVAHAEIGDSLAFLLSPHFGFHGNVTSTANHLNDYYEGYFRLTESCLEDTVWFYSTTEITPDTVRIPIQMEQVRKKRQGLFNGLCYEFGSNGGYHVNFMKPMNPETVPVKMQDGILYYDTERHEYRIQEVEHEQDWMTLTHRCIVTQHGASDMGFDLGLTGMTCYGDYTAYPNDSVTLEVLNVFQAPVFDDQILKEIAEVYAGVEGESVDLTQTDFVEYLRAEKGEEDAITLQQDLELTGYPEINSGSFYNNTIVIPSLKMVWNPTLKAFISEGKIGLGNLGKNVVNRYVDGYVVFDRRMGVITYFFQNDLFMTYLSYNCADGQLQVHATYGTVNTKLADMKEKSRTVKTKAASFEYVVTPYEALTNFLSRLKRAGVK